MHAEREILAGKALDLRLLDLNFSLAYTHSQIISASGGEAHGHLVAAPNLLQYPGAPMLGTAPQHSREDT